MKRIGLLKLSVVSAAMAISAISALSPSMAYHDRGGREQPNGGALFNEKCALCHGKDGTGLQSWRSKGIPNFADAQWQKSRTDAQIADTIRNGKGRFMPSFKAKLSDAEINALVGRIRQFKK